MTVGPCEPEQFKMFVSRIIGDSFIDQTLLTDWHSVSDYTLASCSRYIAYVGGSDMEMNASRDLQFYKLHDLSAQVFSVAQMIEARIAPSCVFDDQCKTLYVYGGWRATGEFIHSAEMIELG